MCGIVGAASTRDVVEILIEGIKKLEYRGYDSAGIAFLKDGHLERLRSTGRVAHLEEIARKEQDRGQHRALPYPLGDPRRAERGERAPAFLRRRRPRDRRRPQRHRRELRGDTRAHEAASAIPFRSETDTEVLAHHVHSLVTAKGLSLFDAVMEASREWEGAYAAGFISSREPDTVVGARKGSPLLVGLGQGENFLASDASALISRTRRGGLPARGRHRRGAARAACAYCDGEGRFVDRSPTISRLSQESVELRAVRALHAEGDLRAAGRARQHARDGAERAFAAAQPLRRRGRSGVRPGTTRCCCSPAARAITPASSRATGWRRSPDCRRRSRSRASTAIAIR